MATRENQGLQIALILFVMITVALAISTYVYFRKSEEMIAEAAAANESKLAADRAVRAALDESDKLKQFIGWPEDAKIAEIEATFQQDMTQFSADYPPEEPKNYRKLPNDIRTALNQQQALVADAAERARADAATILEKEKTAADTIAIAEASKQKEIDDRLAQLQAYNADRQKHRDFTTTYTKEKEDLGKKYDALVATSDQLKKSLEDQIAKEVDRGDALATRLTSLTKTTFETADGQITWVNQVAGKVTIDVGLLDGLRPQTSFKVYPPGQNSYEVENSKGTIEVISLLDKHRAEARIVLDETTNPILPGDFIYTPLWRPGTKVRFALAGVIDVDDDGQSDRDLVRSLITLNGGIVDAEVDEEGKQSGKMTVDTRYLVVGKRPTETTDAAARTGYTNMQFKAEELAVEQITVDKLLDYLNYRGTERSVKLGKGANPKDFKAEPPEGGNRTSQGQGFENRFPERRAPEPSQEGAF